MCSKVDEMANLEDTLPFLLRIWFSDGVQYGSDRPGSPKTSGAA